MLRKKETKTDLIHIRIEPEIKEKSEMIFKKLGVNTSYAISMFLNQVILRGGFHFEIELPKNNNEEYTNLANIKEQTKLDDYETTMVNLGMIKLLKSDIEIGKVNDIFLIHKSLFENVYE